MKPLPNYKFAYGLIDILLRPFATKKALPPTNDIKKIIVFESHLIGDTVLILPLLGVLKKAFPKAEILLLAGPWAKPIIKRSNASVQVATISLPWLQKGTLKKLVSIPSFVSMIIWLRRFRSDMFIENRGDVRNIVLGRLICPTHRIGYDFSCGATLLNQIVHDDGDRKHLIAYNYEIARIFSKDITPEDFIPRLQAIRRENLRPDRATSGSLPTD